MVRPAGDRIGKGGRSVGEGRRVEPGMAVPSRTGVWWWHRARNRDRDGDKERDRRWQDALTAQARPLVAPAPRSGMFFPLVVLVAVLPGLYALNSWDLTPPGPWWGLRGLAVLDGRVFDQVPAASEIMPAPEARAYRTVALQPPLY